MAGAAQRLAEKVQSGAGPNFLATEWSVLLGTAVRAVLLGAAVRAVVLRTAERAVLLGAAERYLITPSPEA